MNKRTLSAITLSALMSAGIAVAADTAQPVGQDMPPPAGQAAKGQQRAEGRLPRGFAELNLTDAQKTRIQAILAADRPAQQPNREARRADFAQKAAERRQREQALMSAKTFDEQAARALIAERQQERAEMANEFAANELNMLKKRHAVFQVLTPAQQQQWLQQQSRRQAERGQDGKQGQDGKRRHH